MNTIEFGDNREIMKRWAEEGIKVQMCVTSPPYYGLRDYGHDGQIGLEETPEEFIENLVEVFRDVRNILADDGIIWVNMGDSYYNYRPGKGQRQGKQSIAGQKYSEVEESPKRGRVLSGYKEKDLMGIPWMLAFALRVDGWYLRQDIIWHKPNPMPESVRDRCTKNHEYVFLLSKNAHYFYDNEAIKEPSLTSDKNVRDRDTTKLNNVPGRSRMSGLTKNDYEMKNKRSVWTVTTKPFSGAHFATYPPDLIEPCILAGSKVGDIVLDPFMGSGTTAGVALKHGRQYLGCELNPEYRNIQKERIESITKTSLQEIVEDDSVKVIENSIERWI